jgi:hypothetical protein
MHTIYKTLKFLRRVGKMMGKYPQETWRRRMDKMAEMAAF